MNLDNDKIYLYLRGHGLSLSRSFGRGRDEASIDGGIHNPIEPIDGAGIGGRRAAATRDKNRRYGGMLGARQGTKIAYLVQRLAHKEDLDNGAVIYPAASNLEDECTSRRSRVKCLVRQKPIEMEQTAKPTQVGVVPNE